MAEDKNLTCRDCGKTFVFTAGEQAFFAHHVEYRRHASVGNHTLARQHAALLNVEAVRVGHLVSCEAGGMGEDLLGRRGQK